MKDLNSKNSIVLLVDGLRPNMLGPYGNTWFDTTRFNQLACESLVFEQCISDSPDIQLGLRGILDGLHALHDGPVDRSLLDLLGEEDLSTTLVTWDLSRFEGYESSFSKVVEIEIGTPSLSAGDISSTQMANFFAAVVETVAQQQQPGMLLLDCPGVAGFWDAPYQMRIQLADPEDPQPSDSIEVPKMQFNAAVDDPDVLLDYQIGLGAQVGMLDELLEFVLDAIEQSTWGRRSMLCLTATRGFPLGEHGVVGFYRPTLFNECTQVPLIVRWPIFSRVTGRSQQLVQPGSLFNLLADWHGVQRDRRGQFPTIQPQRVLPEKSSMAVVSHCEFEGNTVQAIQTAAWKLIAGPSRQLFVKPDDIWEYNNVAELCDHIADDLQNQITLMADLLRQGAVPAIGLSDTLAFGVE